MRIEILPPIVTLPLPIKAPHLRWERGKGWSFNMKQVSLTFPPRLLLLEVKKSGGQRPNHPGS